MGKNQSRKVKGKQQKHVATDADPPMSSSTSRVVSKDEACLFVDHHRTKLIERVIMVKPILDLLLQEGVITPEGYNNVTSKDTKQNKMRELYEHLNSSTSKHMFYKGLEEHEKCLLDDLCPQPSPPSLSATQPKAASTSDPEFLVETKMHTRPITHYQDKLKTNADGTVQKADKKDFEYYTRLTIARVDDTEISSDHEVTQMERKKAGQEIQLSEIFTHPSGQDKRMRTVMSIGEAGVGKTFLVHKLVSDWAKKKDQDPHLTFVLQFRQLNLFKGRKFSLAQLIHECNPTYKCISEEALNDIFTKLQTSEEPNYDKSPCKVQFVLDGLDESHMTLDFKTHHECSKDLSQATSLEVLLVNLITGRLLHCASIWITTRPAAAKQIPDGFVDMVTEVKGFTDEMKEKYIRKRIGDEKQASRTISHIKASKNLHIMCETPVFCSIIATVLQDVLKTGVKGELPKTLAEIYSHFIFVQTKRKWLKHGENQHQQELTEADKAVLLKLGRLAFEHLLKGRLIFYEEDLRRCHLDMKEGPVDSGLCTEIFKPDSKFFQKTVYCFVHLSIQEFLAAVYLFDCFTQKNMEVLKAFLNNDDFNSNSSLSDFLKAAIEKTLQSESGHLDLFVRFLHGISLESNQRGLGGLLGQTKNSPEEIQRAITNLKEMDPCSGSPDRCINIFQCLMEMKAHSVSQGIQQYLESGKELSETQCSALVRMLQMSEEVLEELDLQKCNTSESGRWNLVPAVRDCKTARLVGCNLQEDDIEVVASALSSNPSHLRELDLSGNGLEVSGLELICAELKSPHCCLDILRLKNCWLSERCCEVLASALTSNPSLHLRELDLTLNMVTESGMKTLLSLAGLKNLKVTHGGEDRFNPHLIKGYYHPLTLDTNTAYRLLSLSEKNRKVTYDRQDHHYPPHPDRFDGPPQVLCSEGLTGHCYWEVEWEGEWVSIAVTDRGISRKRRGNDSLLGYNDMSWSLYCRGEQHGDSYCVIHNSKQTVLPVRPSRGSNRVAVYLDCSAGTLSFYKISEDILIHLFTFRDTFTEPLYAGFWLLYSSSSVFLCEQR